MAIQPLKYLSRQTSDDLYDNIQNNIERYRDGDFLDMVENGGWSIELSIRVDLDPLEELVKSSEPDAEIENSLLVWNALHKLQQSLACENRLWTRMTHVECLDYSRFRWLGAENAKDEKLVKDIRTHFFANTQTKYRDDNAISRLWWNAYIAKLAAPDNQERALRAILKTADIRSNFIERSRTVSRPVIAAGIVRIMLSDAWLTERERHFREFMITLNRLGGGKVFELWQESRVNDFLEHCLAQARKSVVAQA